MKWIMIVIRFLKFHFFLLFFLILDRKFQFFVNRRGELFDLFNVGGINWFHVNEHTRKLDNSFWTFSSRNYRMKIHLVSDQFIIVTKKWIAKTYVPSRRPVVRWAFINFLFNFNVNKILHKWFYSLLVWCIIIFYQFTKCVWKLYHDMIFKVNLNFVWFYFIIGEKLIWYKFIVVHSVKPNVISGELIFIAIDVFPYLI